jgi:hypothetical protein
MNLNMERCDELIGEYLDGSLSPSGQEKLADLARADAAVRHRFVMQAELAGLLRHHFQPEYHAADLIRCTMASLPEHPPGRLADDQTVDIVMSRIASPRSLITRAEKQDRQQAAFNEFALRSALQTQAQMARIPRFGRWMSFAALLAMAACPMTLFALARSLHTIAAVPVLHPLSGNVYVISPESNLERGVKESLAASDGIVVDSRARAAVTYWDGTRMELSGDVGRLWMSKHAASNRASTQEGQDRCVLLESGTLEVAAARQHKNQPLVLMTPHAVVEVLGTKFVLNVGANETRVTVLEGKVRFIRATDQQSISVGANEYAVATPSAELVAKPLAEPN